MQHQKMCTSRLCDGWRRGSLSIEAFSALQAYEASPFCLQTREVLTELEIPHIYRSVARKSPKRPAFEAKWGVFQVRSFDTALLVYDDHIGSAPCCGMLRSWLLTLHICCCL